MEKLRRRFGSLYTESNVNLNAQHSHASCGGTAWDYAYSLAAFGFKKNSYDAEVDGMFAAIVRAHENLAPGTITIGREELHNASANRSRVAFDANPSSEKKLFPQRDRSAGHRPPPTARRRQGCRGGHHLVLDPRDVTRRPQRADRR